MVPGVVGMGYTVRTLVGPRGMGPGTSLTGPSRLIWEKQRAGQGVYPLAGQGFTLAGQGLS